MCLWVFLAKCVGADSQGVVLRTAPYGEMHSALKRGDLVVGGGRRLKNWPKASEKF